MDFSLNFKKSCFLYFPLVWHHIFRVIFNYFLRFYSGTVNIFLIWYFQNSPKSIFWATGESYSDSLLIPRGWGSQLKVYRILRPMQQTSIQYSTDRRHSSLSFLLFFFRAIGLWYLLLLRTLFLEEYLRKYWWVVTIAAVNP